MSSKFALVIANTEYQDASFAKLTAPGKDAEEFAQVLRDPELAAFEDVQILLNERESNLRRAIARFFVDRKRDDLLLLYFSGHGIRNGQGQLFLAANDTEIKILEATGIPAEFITYAMNNSRSQRQLLILDCCNSGAFAYGSKSASGVGQSMGIATAFEGSGFGRVVLTATDATQFAWEGDKVIGDTQKSVFTHFLIEGLKGGADRDGDGRIDVDELYDYAYEEVVSRTPKQTPGKWSYKQQGDILLRENLKPRDVKPALLPSELFEMLSHPNSGVRRAGIQELMGLLDGKHLGLARAAQEKLKEIAENDDSLNLRKSANDTLMARGFAIEQPTPPVITPPPAKEETLTTSVEVSNENVPLEKSVSISAEFPKAEHKEEKRTEKASIVSSLPPAAPLKQIKNEVKGVGDTSLHRLPHQQKTTRKLNLRLIGGVIGGLLVITLFIWGGARITNTPYPTQTPIAGLDIGSTMTGKDGMILLFVPAGEFTMGSDTGYDNEKPVHTVDLDAFWIDKTEVTNAMFAKFIDETGHLTDAEREGKSWVDQDNDTNQVDGANWLHPLGPSNGISDIMDHPVVHVSLNDAQAYCSWANRRLPTEAEWEKAASWDAKKQTKYVYPWGNDEPNNNLLNYNGAVGDTTEVGKYPDGASPYGALDMAGNVFEWINDWYVEGYYASLGKNARNPQGPTNGGGAGILRGGAWNLDLILVRSSYRRVDASIATTNSYGFRCSRSP